MYRVVVWKKPRLLLAHGKERKHQKVIPGVTVFAGDVPKIREQPGVTVLDVDDDLVMQLRGLKEAPQLDDLDVSDLAVFAAAGFEEAKDLLFKAC